ncbi:MAG: leucine-rich repeat protein [Lachnospiraceae bacterium]|nr:leucine-rich repeat protein [Lachnospiraceae bacterium]
MGGGILSCSLPACAEEYTGDNLIYTENEDGTLTVNGYEPDATDTYSDLTIPTKVNDKRVTSIADSAFKDCTFCTCSIGSDITIGAHAFENAVFDVFLSIGDSTTGYNRIGEYAFANATFSKDITFASNIDIGDYAFVNTRIPNPKIMQEKSVVYTIGKGAFENSQYTSGLNYSRIVSIGENAFYKSRLQEFTISSSIQSIGANAFLLERQGLSGSARIYIDSSVTDISTFHLEDSQCAIFYVENGPLAEYCQTHDMPFYLTNTFNDNAPAMAGQILPDPDAYLKVREDDTLILLNIATSDHSIDLNNYRICTYNSHPYTLCAVESYALSGSGLTEIILADSITQLEPYALSYQSPLAITLSPEIEYVGEHAFPDFETTTVTIPESVTSLSASLCPGIWHSKALFLLAKNSPLIPMFEAQGCHYQTYENTSVTPGTSFTKNGIVYTQKEDDTLSVTGYDESLTRNSSPYIRIYNTVDGKTVTDISDSAFKDFPSRPRAYTSRNPPPCLSEPVLSILQTMRTD